MNRDPANTKGRGNQFEGLLEAHILSVDADRGEMVVDLRNGNGKKTLPVASVYSGLNSRRRDMPEPGGIVLFMYCHNNSALPQILGYKSRSETNDFINGGQASTSVESQYVKSNKSTTETIPYRKLVSGESEDISAGGSYIYRLITGDMELGSGLIRSVWSRGDMSITHQVPEYVIEMGDYDSGSQADVFRIGNATRHSADGKSYNEAKGGIAKEFYIDLTGRGTTPTLMRIRKGNVLDAGGAEVNSTTTGNALRSFEEYYTKSNTVATYEVDENGNMCWTLPADADRGFIFNMAGSNSSFDLNVGNNLNHKVAKAGKHEYGTSHDIQVGTNSTETVGGNKDSNISGNLNHKVSGSAGIKAGGIIRLQGAKVLIN